MTYHPNIQPRDLGTIRRLAYCYRLTTSKFEAGYHGIGISTARKRLNQLCQGRLLCRLRAWACDIPPITGPLFEWEPGDPEPDFGAIAWAAQERWRSLVPKETTIYVVAKKALSLLGLPPRPRVKLLHHVTHDLAMCEVYSYCQKVFPKYDFLGEDMFAPFRGHGEGVEDAQLIDGQGNVRRIVEHAGRYRKDRCVHFHEHVAERGLPYSLF